MKTQVIHIVQRMAPGGIETLVLDLALADPDISVISLEGDARDLVGAWPRLCALNGRFSACGKRRGHDPRLAIRLAGLLKRSACSAVVLHHEGPLVYGGVAALLAGITRRVHVEHDAWHYDHGRSAPIARFMNWILAPRRVAVSRRTAEAATAILGGACEVIPNGVDLDRFLPLPKTWLRAALDLPPDAALIGCVGRLTHVKGQDQLITALALTPAHIHAVIVGDGDRAQALHTLARQLAVVGRVHFLGHRDDLDRLYPEFDVVCLPSRAEGLPRVAVEAQACGVPVVAFDVGGMAEAVCPVSGRLVSAGEAASLAAALAESLASHAADRPRNFASSKFSLQLTLGSYRALTLA